MDPWDNENDSGIDDDTTNRKDGEDCDLLTDPNLVPSYLFSFPFTIFLKWVRKTHNVRGKGKKFSLNLPKRTSRGTSTVTGEDHKPDGT